MLMLLLIIDLVNVAFKNELMHTNYQSINRLKVSDKLVSFVNNELLKGINISPQKFWLEFDDAVHELAPKNRELIKHREVIQKKIDAWHIKNKNIEIGDYKNFLKEIGYLILKM